MQESEELLRTKVVQLAQVRPDIYRKFDITVNIFCFCIFVKYMHNFDFV